MKKIFTLLICLITLSVAQAQREETLFNRTRLDMTGFWYTDSYNFTFFDEDTEYFSGGNVGFEFNRNFILGWSWQRMRDYAALDNNAQLGYRMRHNGLLLGYVPGSSKVVHPYLSATIGGGRLDFDDGADFTRDRIFVIQPALGLEVNVFRWFHLGVEGGYRLVNDVDHPNITSTDMSKPYAQIQLRFGYSWGGRW
jgi:hypothetical protein